MNRAEQRQFCAGAFPQRSLRNLMFHLRDNSLRLYEPVVGLRRRAQVSAGNEMKAAIAPRSLYQLRGAGWRWRRRGWGYA